MPGTFLSRFTPSLMPPEVLESIFVQREGRAREILDRIRQSLYTRAKFHTVLVGSRGLGKTHLISIVHNRIRQDEELAGRVIVAWLREEEWGVDSLVEVVLRTLRAAVSTCDDPALARWVESLYDLPAGQAEREATAILRGMVGNRTLVVFAENLDDLFRGLGEEGQFQLRNYLEENPYWMFVATAQAPWPGFRSPDSPFFDIFQVHMLEGLSLDDTSLLLSRIAQHTGDWELAAYLPTPTGRSRVRALHSLSGGNHRACVIFSQFITRKSIEDLVDPLVRTIDDLTPYYQSRMAGLEPEQRKILEWMCERRSPVTVQEVASRCFVPPGDAFDHLEWLHEAGYIRSLVLERRKYYELREPLMRLSIEVKRHRGEPVRLLVEFLGLWYSPVELKGQLEGLRKDAGLERGYLLPALEMAASGQEDPRVAVCSQEYNYAVRRGNFEDALRSIEELTVIRDEGQDWFARAICLARLGRTQEALDVCDRMIALAPSEARGWALRATLLHTLGHHQLALKSCDTALELSPDAADVHATRAEILETHGRYEDAVVSYHRAIALDPEDSSAHLGCGVVLSGLGRFEEALSFLETARSLDPDNARSFVYESAALIELKRLDEALLRADGAIARSATDPLGWVVRGSALTSLLHREDALEAFRQAIRMGDDSPFVRFKEAELLLALQRWREGGAALDDALRRFAHADPPDAGNTAALARNVSALLPDQSRARLAIRLLVLLYRKHRVLRPLAQGIVSSVSAVAGNTPAQMRLWRDLWREWSEEPELNAALRLLDTATAYQESSDPRVLLELPLEERLMLEPLLGVRALESA